MTIWHFAKSPRFLVAALAVIVFAAAVACSGDDDDDAQSPTQAPAASATEAQPASGDGAEATPAEDASAPLAVSVEEGDLGPYLAGPDGKALYVFTRDDPSTSNCTGDCLSTWPPLLLEDGQSVEAGAGATGTFDSIETEAGQLVTYNGAPLYYFSADSAPGDTNGNLVGNVWFLARPETASTAYVGVRDSFLVGPTGMTLYLFANDTEGVSNCTDQCLENWPALTVPEGMEPSAVPDAGGALDVITREDDGTLHITYNGLPLYYFAGDSLPGDTNGDGVAGVWSLAMP
jgi:predicted lipoprotein with Yx(FWY)xxD motif